MLADLLSSDYGIYALPYLAHDPEQSEDPILDILDCPTVFPYIRSAGPRISPLSALVFWPGLVEFGYIGGQWSAVIPLYRAQ